MAPLRTIMETGLAQLGIKDVDTAACQMIFNGEPLDLSLPTRFANIPSGSKLVVITGEDEMRELGLQVYIASGRALQRPSVFGFPTGHERKLGVQDVPSTDTRVALPKDEERRDLVSTGVDTPKERTMMIPNEPPGQSPPHLSGGTSANDAQGSREQEPTTSRASNLPSESSRAIASEDRDLVPADKQTEPSTSRNQHPSHTIFGRTVYLFHRSVESRSNDIVPREDVPDDFYEFTEMDLRRMMAGYAANRAREAASATLKTNEVCEVLL